MTSGTETSFNVGLSRWMYRYTLIYLPTCISGWGLGTTQNLFNFYMALHPFPHTTKKDHATLDFTVTNEA